MRPRNKTQEEISHLVGYLPGLRQEHEEWAKLNCFAPDAIRRKSGETTCTLCGHQWQSEKELANPIAGISCPHCKSELKVKLSKKRVIDEIGYMTIADEVGGYQVLRNFLVTKKFDIGEKVTVSISEVVQTWFTEEGRCIAIARGRNQSYYRCRQPFSFSREMDFKSKIVNEYKIWGEVYPEVYIIDKLKKRGLKSFPTCNPYYLVENLLKNSVRTETLLKTGQIDLLTAYTSTSRDVEISRYWNQVRIATKHKYIIKDPIMWLDYLKLLSYFRKDLNNPHYICPVNLKEAHDKFMNMKRKRDAEEERLRKQQQIEREARMYKEFEERIKKFLHLKFADEDIEIVPLTSIDDFIKESEIMHHCVFTNRYFERKDCLILSARIGEKHIETVEVDLKKYQVVQSRGVNNQITPYHDQIVNLINSNINMIRSVA